MGEHYILSICMMVKNEEKNLRRCLDSLKTLLLEPDVELIIVDTGSTDKTIDIALQYTSKVYCHQWNNNFSDMRNITISYARGERILILDADEVLVNADELYELIKDPRFKEYNTFMLKLKSFIGPTRDFTVLSQERVFKNDGEFKYEGAVHNQPVFKSPVLSTDIYCEHYGYMSNDRETMERKFKRTSAILKDELEKNPKSIYYRYQLAKSYDSHGDHREALWEIRKAYDLAADERSRKLYLFGEYALICVKSIEYEEAIKICTEGIGIEPDYLDLYYMMGEASQKLGRNQEAFEAFSKYLILLEKFDTLRISHDRSVEMLFMGISFKDVALSFIINSLTANGKYKEAEAYALLMNDVKVKVEFLFNIYLKLKEYEKSYELYIQNLENSEIIGMFAALAEEEKKIISEDESMALVKLFSTGEDAYSLLNRIRISKDERLPEIINQLCSKADLNILPDYYADMFQAFSLTPKLMFKYIKSLRKTKIRCYIKRFMDFSYEAGLALEDFLLKESAREDDYNNLRLRISISFAILFKKAADLDKENLEIPDKYNLIFKDYISCGIKYINILYKIERLRLYADTIEDQEDRFFILLFFAFELIRKGDYKSSIRYFSEAVKVNSYMACYMLSYKDEIFKNIQFQKD